MISKLAIEQPNGKFAYHSVTLSLLLNIACDTVKLPRIFNPPNTYSGSRFFGRCGNKAVCGIQYGGIHLMQIHQVDENSSSDSGVLGACLLAKRVMA